MRPIGPPDWTTASSQYWIDLAQEAEQRARQAQSSALAQKAMEQYLYAQPNIYTTTTVIPTETTTYYNPQPALPFDKEEIENLKERIKFLESESRDKDYIIAGQQEMIEILAEDALELDTLREENARLRILGCIKVKASEPLIRKPTYEEELQVTGGWLSWTPHSKGGSGPALLMGTHVCVKLRSSPHHSEHTSLPVEIWDWALFPLCRGRKL